jgi:predicted Rossmann fold flavoprotein
MHKIRQMAGSFNVVVLGAGAAGMMCAAEAGKRGRRALLLEHSEQVGRKILISGGGRCNFTNVNARAENFLSANPHFAKSALARYTPRDFIALVERHGIAYHEKTLGQLFCDGSARQIVSMLEKECAAAGVEIRCGVTVGNVNVNINSHSGERFTVETNEGAIACEVVVVATGGLSIPKMGATGFGYELARELGHAVVEPRAGLVPLVFAEQDCKRWCDLTGISAEVIARANSVPSGSKKLGGRPDRSDKSNILFREKLLVTHRGVSGPAVLQVSSYWRPGDEVRFDLAPGRELLGALLAKNARRDAPSLLAVLRGVLPARMAERWVKIHTVERKADWTNAGIARMEQELHAWTVKPAGTEGFAKAEVTVGGVDTAELDARTMESKRVKGLYFTGEVVDVTGWLGGYNFQWAWASAVAAGTVA